MDYQHEYHLTSTADPSQSPVKPLRIKHLTQNILIISGGIISLCFVCLAVVYVSKCKLTDCSNDSFHTNLTYTSSSVLELNESLWNNQDVDNPYEKIFKSTLSESETNKLHTLQQRVANKVTHSYMMLHSFLSTWLKARDWDVDDAEEMLLEHLLWRAENDIDSAMNEDFSYFEREFPIYSDGFDYNRGPVITLSIKDWDTRQLAVAGREKQFFRFIFRVMEQGIQYGLECQAHGFNVSTGMTIINMEKYSFHKHGCFSCISFFGRFLFQMDDNYPGLISHIIFINVSDIASAGLELILPYFTGENKLAVQVYGFNRTEWQNEILKLIPADQIRSDFGGTKIDLETLDI